MKTRATVSKFLKNLGVLTVIGMMAMSCGKDNTSGKSGNSNVPGTTGIYNLPDGGTASMNQIMNIVGQENPCAQGGQRTPVQIPLQNVNVAMGSGYIGVSPFGDIAVVQNVGQPVMSVYICPRAGLSGQGQLLYNPILEKSNNCPVDQITAADIVLGGQVNYQVKFAPIDIPGTDQRSQVCNNMYY